MIGTVLKYCLGICVAAGAIAAAVSYLGPSRSATFAPAAATTTPATTTPPAFMVTHVPTPDPVRAVYYTSWAAGTPSFQKQLFALFSATSTRLNAVVIDIKDYSGRISFAVASSSPLAALAGGAPENRIPDIERFIGRLHDKGIYVIGRIQSFNDPYAVKVHPDWAVKAANGTLWRD